MKGDWFTTKVVSQVSGDLETRLYEIGQISFGRKNYTEEQRRGHADKYFNNTPFAFIIAFENGTAIGRLKLVKRVVMYDGLEINAGGIRGAAVLPEKQNRGVASELIKQAMSELKNAGCDMAYINTDVKNSARIKLYSKFGFVRLPKPHLYRGKSGKIYTDDDGMIAPINSKDAFQAVLGGPAPLNLGDGNW